MDGRTLTATSGEERLGGLAVAGLLLVPVLVGVLLAWGLSAPVQHLDRVTAAVVNDDAPVTLSGQTVPLGRQLAAGPVPAVGPLGFNMRSNSRAVTTSGKP